MGDGTTARSDQLIAGASKLFFHDRLKLRVTHEQSLGGQNASDRLFRPAPWLGAEFKLTEQVGLFAEHELTVGDDQDTHSSRLGLKTTPGPADRSVHPWAAIILKTATGCSPIWGWPKPGGSSDHWRLDAGLDRSQSLADSENASCDQSQLSDRRRQR